jgi:hypothetical protein
MVQTLPAGRHAWTAKQQMAEVLALICRYTATTPSALAAHVPDVVVALADSTFQDEFPDSIKLRMRCSCLSCLAQISHNMQGKAAVREAGAIPVLAKLLNEKDGTTISKTLSVFMALSIDTESKYAILQVSDKVNGQSLLRTPCNVSTSRSDRLARMMNVVDCNVTC